MNLHKINDGFIQLEQISRKIERMEQNGENPILIDELKDQLQKEFDNADLLLTEKLDNMMYFIINKEADIKALKEESARLSKRAMSRQKTIDYIKKTVIKTALENTKTGKHKSVIGSFYPMNTESVEIKQLELIPDSYKKEITEIRVDKSEIKKALKEGEKIQGAELKKNTSIVFRK